MFTICDGVLARALTRTDLLDVVDGRREVARTEAWEMRLRLTCRAVAIRLGFGDIAQTRGRESAISQFDNPRCVSLQILALQDTGTPRLAKFNNSEVLYR